MKTHDPRYRFDYELYTEFLEGILDPEVKWLDAGCGRNLWVDEYRVVELGLGVDRMLHPNLKGRERFVLGDLSLLPFKDGVFNLITCRSVVEHLSHPLVVFQQFHRALGRGGTLLVQTTNRLAPLVFVANLLPWSWKRTLIELLAGVPEQDIHATPHRFNSPDTFEEGIVGFLTTDVVPNENLFTLSGPLFLLHYLLYSLSRGSRFRWYYSTITATFEKR